MLRLELQVDSGRGKGTRFSVILPISDAEEPAAAAEAAPAAAAGRGAQRHGGALHRQRPAHPRRHAAPARGLGLSASLTHAGSKSIADAGRDRHPDIILADYHLDGETGLDPIRKLRARFGEAIPAVLVTADRSNEVRAAADLIDVPVINKPLKPAVLRSLMTRLRRMTPAAAE